MKTTITYKKTKLVLDTIEARRPTATVTGMPELVSNILEFSDDFKDAKKDLEKLKVNIKELTAYIRDETDVDTLRFVGEASRSVDVLAAYEDKSLTKDEAKQVKKAVGKKVYEGLVQESYALNITGGLAKVVMEFIRDLNGGVSSEYEEVHTYKVLKDRLPQIKQLQEEGYNEVLEQLVDKMKPGLKVVINAYNPVEG